MARRKRKNKQEKLRRIDAAVKQLREGSLGEKELASRELLSMFEPLVKSAAKRIADKFPHSTEEVVPLVENKLIMMIIDFKTPRRDTRGAGELKGAWAPNINVYLKKNLYYFSMLEVSKDIDGPKRDFEGKRSTRQGSALIEGGAYPLSETQVGVRSGVNEILDIVEDLYGAKGRDLVMLRYIFRLKQSQIAEITEMSQVQIRNMMSKIKEKLAEVL